MITLAIDASTYIGTIVLIADAEVVAEGDAVMRGEHEERLMPMVAATLSAAGAVIADVDRVVCGAGPGSFTSLRIAASIAKGLATGASLPLYAVPSLGLLAAASEQRGAGEYVAAMDAMRGDWYAGVYAVELDNPGAAKGCVVQRRPATVVSASELRLLVVAHGGRLVGATLSTAGEDGEPTVTTNASDRPHARALVRLDPSLQAGPVDLGSWEPVYGRLAEAQVKWEAAHGRPLAPS